MLCSSFTTSASRSISTIPALPPASTSRCCRLAPFLIGSDVLVVTPFNRANHQRFDGRHRRRSTARTSLNCRGCVETAAVGLTQNIKPTGAALGPLAADSQVKASLRRDRRRRDRGCGHRHHQVHCRQRSVTPASSRWKSGCTSPGRRWFSMSRRRLRSYAGDGSRAGARFSGRDGGRCQRRFSTCKIKSRKI